MVLDDSLVDEYPLRPAATVDLDRVVGTIHLVDDETVREAVALEQQVCDLVVKLLLRAIEVADYAGGLRRFWVESRIVKACPGVVGLKVEVLERRVGWGEDVRLQFEVA